MARQNATNGKRLGTQQSVNSVVKGVCDIMRRSNVAGAMNYVPELTWLLFLRILDEREDVEAMEEAVLGNPFTPSLAAPYRWQDWAAPGGTQRVALTGEASTAGDLLSFVNGELLPHLRGLGGRTDATPRQKIISQVLSQVQRTKLDTEFNLLEVLDRVHAIKDDAIDATHVFPLSQVFEGLLLQMGEKGNDGGQFFTPREVIRAIVKAVAPRPGQTVYDPGCGTGGFLAQAYEYMHDAATLGTEIDGLKHDSFFGREKDDTVYPIALANLILHGIDQPNLWHGNTLTNQEVFGDLFRTAPAVFDVILTNPPFGGKEGSEAQTNFAYKTSSTQVLFIQHVLDHLRPAGGICGMVVDEGVLFRTNEGGFVKTKKKLLDECDLWCVVSLPGGVFTAAGAGVKTNLLFFTKGAPSEAIWYYDLSDVKVLKKTPLTLGHFDEFFRLLPSRGESERSWTVRLSEKKATATAEAAPVQAEAAAKAGEVKKLTAAWTAAKKTHGAKSPQALAALGTLGTAKKELTELTKRAQAILDSVYDLKAVNPNTVTTEDTRTPAQLIQTIEAQGRAVAAALAVLKG